MTDIDLIPHLALRLAVLTRAIADAHGSGLMYQREKREAINWLTSNDDTSDFSFLTICFVLNLEPEKVRAVALNPDGPYVVGMSISRAVRYVYDLAPPDVREYSISAQLSTSWDTKGGY